MTKKFSNQAEKVLCYVNVMNNLFILKQIGAR